MPDKCNWCGSTTALCFEGCHCSKCVSIFDERNKTKKFKFRTDIKYESIFGAEDNFVARKKNAWLFLNKQK